MNQSKKVILKVEHVTKEFSTVNGTKFKALDDISLEISEGECLGIVGESGSGKSTLAKLIANLSLVTSGIITYKDKILSGIKGEELRRSRENIQMIFQDASLAFNPRMVVKDIVCEPLMNFKRIKNNEKTQYAKKLLEMVGLDERFLERYPHQMSGGQRQRVGIARAFALEPELIICDEATSALDVSVQESVINLLKDLQAKKNTQYIFICHDVALVDGFCNKLVVMYMGNIVEILVNKKLKKNAMHPYTKMLINSIFSIGENKAIPVIKEEIQLEKRSQTGCIFQNRCEQCMEICRKEKPVLSEIEEGHLTACHLYGK